MHRHARNRFAAALAILALSLVAARPAGAEVAWRQWNAGLAEARKSGKPVLVDVYTDWCSWCKRMDREVYSQASVQSTIARHFVAVKLNAEARTLGTLQGKEASYSAIARSYGVSGYPTTVFLRPTGAHLGNVPGYIPAADFTLMLRYIGEGHMDRGVKFPDFKAQADATPAKPAR